MRLSVFILSLCLLMSEMATGKDSSMTMLEAIKLPKPKLAGKISVEEAIDARRTRRGFSSKPLAIEDLSQLLWAGQGITEKKWKHRAAPSAGALYPVYVYIHVRRNMVNGLKEGIYRYVPEGHYLQLIKKGDYTKELSQVGYSQTFFAQSPVCFILTGIYSITTWKYGDRGKRYVHMEMGHIAQNIMLQGEALRLNVGLAGAFRDGHLSSLLELKKGEKPFYIIPAGHRK